MRDPIPFARYRIPTPLRREMQQRADAEGDSETDWLVDAIRQKLRKTQKKVTSTDPIARAAERRAR